MRPCEKAGCLLVPSVGWRQQEFWAATDFELHVLVAAVFALMACCLKSFGGAANARNSFLVVAVAVQMEAGDGAQCQGCCSMALKRCAVLMQLECCNSGASSGSAQRSCYLHGQCVPDSLRQWRQVRAGSYASDAKMLGLDC